MQSNGTQPESLSRHMRRASIDGDWHGDATYVGTVLGQSIDELRETVRGLQAQLDMVSRWCERLDAERVPRPPQPREQLPLAPSIEEQLEVVAS